MKINIFGSTGIIGSKTLNIISKEFPLIKVNLLCADKNVKKLIKQCKIYKPNYVYLNDDKKYKILKSNIYSNTKILNFSELINYLNISESDYSLLAISGYHSLKYFKSILNNTKSLGLVNKEAIVSAGHIFLKYKKNLKNKIYPLDSEHFSIFKNINSNQLNNINNLTLTASGGPFHGKKFKDLKNVSFKKASTHPKWKMGYKNSIDSATLANKCLELIEAHYLFEIPFSKLNIKIHPESKVHSIIEYRNYFYNMIVFQNDMSIPIYHFLNQKFNYDLNNPKLSISNIKNYTFYDVKYDQFPIYKLFCKLDKEDPKNLINFNVANEFAVNLFKRNLIRYTDIYNIIDKITCLNLNYKLNNIKDIINYHDELEIKIKNQFYTSI
tara:strand:+ start:1246 stop:2394 length:1149 start_codon:yes stop_codon:yes gene_type:complete